MSLQTGIVKYHGQHRTELLCMFTPSECIVCGTFTTNTVEHRGHEYPGCSAACFVGKTILLEE